MGKEKENQESNKKSGESLLKAIDRLLQDASYRKSFEADPVRVLENLGVNVSDEQKKQVQPSSSAYIDPKAIAYYNLMQQQALQAQAVQQAFQGQNLACPDLNGAYYYNPQQFQTPAIQNYGPYGFPYVYPIVTVYPIVNTTTLSPRPAVMNLNNYNYGYPQADILQQSLLPQIQYASNYTYYPNAGYNFGSYIPQQPQYASAPQSPVNAQDIGLFVAPVVNVATAGTRPAVNVVTAGTKPPVNEAVNVSTGSILTGEDPFADDPSLRGMAVDSPAGNLQDTPTFPSNNIVQQQILACQQAQAMLQAQAAMQAKIREQLIQQQQSQLEHAKSVLRGVQEFQQTLMNSGAPMTVEELEFSDKFASAVDQLLTNTELRQEFDQDPIGILNRLGVVFSDETRGKEVARLLQESLRNSRQSVSSEDTSLSIFPRLAVWVAVRPLPYPRNFPFPQTTVLTQTGVYSRAFF